MRTPTRLVSMCVTLAAVIGSSLVALAQDPTFDGLASWAIGRQPAVLIDGDFNEDGHVDIVAALRGEEGSCTDTQFAGFGVRLGDGAGGFLPRSAYEERYTLTIDSGDFNGDDHLDVVVLVSLDYGVMYLGDGTGGFVQAGFAVLPFDTPQSLTVADFDEDGHLDAAVGYEDETWITVLEGSGAGGLTVFNHVLTGDSRSVALESADLDADGHADLASAGALLSILRGLGTGGFENPIAHATSDSPTGIDVALVDGNARLDILVSTETNPGVDVFLQDAAGAFSLSTVLPLALSPASVTTGDMNQDGRVDIVTGHTGVPLEQPTELSIILSQAGGGFSVAQPLATAHHPLDALVTDLDEDGLADIVAASAGDNSIVVHRGTGDGQFPASLPVTFVVDARPTAVTSGDFDGDGRLDVAFVAEGHSIAINGFASVLLADGSGGFAHAGDFNCGVGPISITTADFDLDGSLDFAIGKVPTGNVAILLGDGAGGFLWTSRLTEPVSRNYAGLISGDWNHDGRPDLAGADNGQGALVVFIGRGDGTFDPPTTIDLPHAAWSVATADFDENGHPDLAVGVIRFDPPRRLAICLGDGTGAFAAPIYTDISSSNGKHVAVLDANEDGDVDVIASGYNCFETTTATLLLGNGAGGFSSASGFADNLSLGPIAVADYDSDGHADFVAANDRAGSCAAFLGDGDGGFQFIGSLVTGYYPEGIVAGDFDGDCHPDFAVASRNGLRFSIHRNRSFDPIAARVGNVNAAAGPPVDVLFVNGSAGVGAERVVSLAIDDPLEIFMASSPSRLRSPFALYKWLVEPSAATVANLPYDLGRMACGPPFDLGCSPPHKHLWNNIGKVPILGVPTHVSTKAPSVVLSLPAGAGRPLTWYLQGFVLDRNALNGIAAVTNGIVVRVE